jgi:hypothetical protein
MGLDCFRCDVWTEVLFVIYTGVSFRLLMHCIRAIRSAGLSFGVIISLDHAAGTQTELAASTYPLAEPDSYHVPGRMSFVWTGARVRIFNFAVSWYDIFPCYFQWIALSSLQQWRCNLFLLNSLGDSWKKNVLLAANSATPISMHLPQIEYISGILIRRGFYFWDYLVDYLVKVRNMCTKLLVVKPEA